MFFQSTTAHCEADALAHVSRDNLHAESITLLDAYDMGFGRLTMFRFEVTLPPRRIIEGDNQQPNSEIDEDHHQLHGTRLERQDSRDCPKE